MSRPMGPKKIAAIEQAGKMKASGMTPQAIRRALIDSGLSKQQANEVEPAGVEATKSTALPVIVDDDYRRANIEGAIHFLETIAQRLNPTVCDRFRELGTLKSDSLTWSRKLRGLL